MGKFVEVDKIAFNVAAVKKMGKKSFKEAFRGKFRKTSIEDAWYLITGAKKSSTKRS